MPIRLDGLPAIGAQAPAAHLERAVQLDFHLLVRPSDLPGVRAAEPVVRLFVLPAVLDGLAEHAVFVTQPVAHGRELHRGHRVEEAGRQAPEPAVAQARVGLLFEQAEPIEVLLLDGLPGERIEQEVRDVVGQRAADEKLHREIVDALGVLALVGVLREHPALREDVPHGAGEGLETLARAGGGQVDDVVEDEVPLVERVVRPRELDRAAAVLLAEFRQAVGARGRRGAAFCLVLIVVSFHIRSNATRHPGCIELSSRASWARLPRFQVRAAGWGPGGPGRGPPGRSRSRRAGASSGRPAARSCAPRSMRTAAAQRRFGAYQKIR